MDYTQIDYTTLQYISWIYTPTPRWSSSCASLPSPSFHPAYEVKNTQTSEEPKTSAAVPELATLVRALDPLDPANSVSAKPRRRQRRAEEAEARGV